MPVAQGSLFLGFYGVNCQHFLGESLGSHGVIPGIPWVYSWDSQGSLPHSLDSFPTFPGFILGIPRVHSHIPGVHSLIP